MRAKMPMTFAAVLIATTTFVRCLGTSNTQNSLGPNVRTGRHSGLGILAPVAHEKLHANNPSAAWLSHLGPRTGGRIRLDQPSGIPHLRWPPPVPPVSKP